MSAAGPPPRPPGRPKDAVPPSEGAERSEFGGLQSDTRPPGGERREAPIGGHHTSEPREEGIVPEDYPLARTILLVAWPAFLVAGVAEIVFFTLFDPSDLLFFGAPLELTRPAMYTMGFFGFWALGTAASALTLFLERRPAGRPPKMPE